MKILNFHICIHIKRQQAMILLQLKYMCSSSTGEAEGNEKDWKHERNDAKQAKGDVWTYRSIEAVTVVVQWFLLLLKVKPDPVVETRHLTAFNLSCRETSTDGGVWKSGHRERPSAKSAQMGENADKPAKMCSKPLESILLLLRE